ncbi:recombinase family protein [Jeotgalibaca sp. MA1X17-3]|uniref:recombinase family protein n=1 Tax=Jeotgalibaca sp. MA1X17-3 TaxID=2908211 RepID=UPI001F423F86|nr:recombinase family protein [Jeotgalibaca sp. MA1X17-3]UJF15954.1 recombinase family protein [Jeotgalibaca sp. MA1X17-3]
MYHKEHIKAVGYIRVSTQEQAVEGHSLGAQREVIKRYCQRKGYDLINCYSDEGISGKSMDKRFGIQDLLEDSKNEQFDVVVIWKLSRLSRKLIDTLSIIDTLSDNNIALESISEKTDFTSTSGILMTQVMASINEFERNVTAENVALGHKAKAHLGEWNGGRVLGYNSVQNERRGNTLVVNPQEAKIIQLIFDYYLNGKGYRAIANELNHQGFTTKRGNSFSTIAVKDILKNPLYKGEILYGKKAKNIKELQDDPIIVKGTHEAIIDPITWNKVNQLLQIRSRNPERNRTGANVLTGLIKCPACGGHMVVNNSYYTRKDGTRIKKKYYVCGAFKNKGTTACNSNSINADEAEQKVSERFKELINSDKLVEHLLLKMKMNSENGKEQLQKKKEILTDKIITASNHRLVYQEKIKSEPNLSDIWQEAINRLAAECDEFRDEIFNIDQRIKKDYSDYDIEQITTLMNALIRKSQSTTNKTELKNLYLAFIKQIQWNKETKKFDIQLHFDETNIAEYLGIKPNPDPDSRPTSIPDNLPNANLKNLPNGRFFLRGALDIWV